MRTLLLLASLLTITTSTAQLLDFTYYGVREGLPQSTVTCLYQDSRGLIWIGTSGGGVASFNGTKIRTYTEKDGFNAKLVNCITEDPSGRILIGSSWGGIGICDGQRFYKLDSTGRYELGGIHKFMWMSDTLLVATQTGLKYWYNDEFRDYTDDALEGGMISGMARHPITGDLFISTQINVFRLAEGWIQDQYSCQSIINEIAFNEEGELLVGTHEGLYLLDEDGLFNVGLGEQSVSALGITDSGLIMIGTDDALIIDGEEHWQLGEKEGLDCDQIHEILQDHNGNLWFGTDGSGLIQWRRNGFSYFENLQGFGSRDIFRITEYDGHLWASDLDGGVYRYNKDGSVSHFPIDTVGQMLIYSLWPQSDRLLVGTNRGLYAISNDRVEDLNKVYFDTLKVTVRSMRVDSKNRLWIGTPGQGLFLFEDSHGHNWSRMDALGNQSIHTIFESSNGDIWFGTGLGAFQYNNDLFIHHTPSDICNSYVGSITEDNLGRVWMGTDRCVSIYDGESYQMLDYETGLNSNTIYLLNKDLNGNIYVGTNAGLNKVILARDGGIKQILKYTVDEGFKGIECNSRSTYLDSAGNLYFGTIYGVIKLANDDIRSTPTIPGLFIKDVELFLKKHAWEKLGFATNWFGVPEKIQLKHDQNHLSFVFDAIDYLSGRSLQYTYMLEGFDDGWSPLSTYDKAIYANLPAGEYYLQVKAVNSAGVWSETVRYGPITIDSPPPPPPPYYQTWWFYVLVGLPIAMLLFYLIVIRTRQLAGSKRQLEEEVAVRTKEIRRQNDEKEVMLKEIHHRVKNNLQIINSLLNLQSNYVTDQESLQSFEESKNRISSMALIHERMYETQDLARIQFGDYVMELANNLVRSYAIDKHITLDVEIEEEEFKMDTLVPLGLIINEIVSNSLKYAYTDRDEGRISISLRSEGMLCHLVIGDDGSGIPADIDWQNSDTLGLQLIQLLTDQIDGKISVMDKPGTNYHLEFTKPAV